MLKIRIKRLKRSSVPSNRILKKIIKKTLEYQHINKGEINLLIADDFKIRELNRKYLNRRGSTDVLAFSMQEGKHLKGSERILGDIIVSIDRARVQAKKFKSTIKKELALYVIHGILHLAGFKDGSEEIEKLQQEILDTVLK